MKTPVFRSDLHNVMERYAERCRAEHSESSLPNDYCALTSLDQYLESINFKGKTVPLTALEGWIHSISYLSSNRVSILITIIGKFLRFASVFGVSSAPVPQHTVIDEYQPYIFTSSDLELLFFEADNISQTSQSKNPWIKAEFPMITRLLYCCGTRLGETLRIQMKNVDLENGIITIQHAKKNKERFVPVSDDLRMILQQYCMGMAIIADPDAFLFPGRTRNEFLSHGVYQGIFHRIITKLNIGPGRSSADGSYSRGACPHCLRHTFACDSLQQLEDNGIILDDRFPYLSTYMGHNGLYDTQKYLKMSDESVYSGTMKTQGYLKKQGFTTRALQNTDEWV